MSESWNHSTCIGLAPMECTYCHGLGTRIVRHGREVACNCVYRAAFRACYNRFRECVAHAGHATTVTLELAQGPKGRCTYSRKSEEFTADFCLVSQRVLSVFDHMVFRYHFLLGADWKLCCAKFHIDRGTFFHAIYQIQQRLGRAFAEIEPYPLYPLDEYFGGSGSFHPPLAVNGGVRREVRPDALLKSFPRDEAPQMEKALAAAAVPI